MRRATSFGSRSNDRRESQMQMFTLIGKHGYVLKTASAATCTITVFAGCYRPPLISPMVCSVITVCGMHCLGAAAASQCASESCPGPCMTGPLLASKIPHGTSIPPAH